MAEGNSKNNNDNVTKGSPLGSDDSKDDEPRLLQDSNPWNLPRHVKLAREAAYSKLSDSDSTEPTVTTPVDILVALAYSLMLESGFVPAEKAHEAAPSRGYHRVNVHNFSSPPKSWREHGCYMMRLALPVCPSDPVRLIAVPSASSLLLTVANVARGTGHSICLQTTRYVTPRSIHINEMMELHNIRELSFKIKNEICTPIRCAILQRAGVENPSLLGLPREVIFYMLNFLNAKDLAMLGACCIYLRDLASDQHLWMNLVNKDFRPINISNSEDEMDWKSEYASRHEELAHQRRRRDRRSRALMPHPAYFLV